MGVSSRLYGNIMYNSEKKLLGYMEVNILEMSRMSLSVKFLGTHLSVLECLKAFPVKGSKHML